MTGPGQNIRDVIDKVHIDTIISMIGEDLVDTLYRLDFSGDKSEAIRTLAAKLVSQRPEMFFTEQAVRNTFYQSMSKEKLEELAKRLSLENVEILDALDPSSSSKIWSRYLGFFGIDLRFVPTTAAPASEVVSSEFGLFRHQRNAVKRVWTAIGDGYGRTVLHMPTGSGKTRTAMHVVSHFLNQCEPTIVVWLAASAELLDQATDAFQHAWSNLGNRNVDMLRFWGDFEPDISSISDGLIVAGLQKLHAVNARDNLALLKLGARVGLVVVDEAHQSIAPTYKTVISRLVDSGKSHALLGLTATPGRSWSEIEKDKQLSDFFGKSKVMLEIEGWEDPVSYLMAEKYLARPNFRRLEYQASEALTEHASELSPGYEDFTDETFEILERETERNVAIVNEVKFLITRGHNRIILFSPSVRHAEIIGACLSVIGIDARTVTGKTSSRSRNRIIESFRARNNKPMVLCNFGVLTTGFDAPQTSAAIIARPTRSLVLFSQMMGRATRGTKAGGNETCEISTVVDVGLPGFGDVAEAFTNWEDVWDEPS